MQHNRLKVYWPAPGPTCAPAHFFLPNLTDNGTDSLADNATNSLTNKLQLSTHCDFKATLTPNSTKRP